MAPHEWAVEIQDILRRAVKVKTYKITEEHTKIIEPKELYYLICMTKFLKVFDMPDNDMKEMMMRSMPYESRFKLK